VNGAFGIGKTTTARALIRRLDRAVLFDPELIGMLLQRLARLGGRRVEDFQDLPSWRRLTVAALRIVRLWRRNVIVPMTFSNAAYLEEIRSGAGRFDARVHHVCLVAPFEVVSDRLRRRDARFADRAWQLRRAAECCAIHPEPQFAVHIAGGERSVEAIVEEILAVIDAS
jgi:predicted kinase